MKKLATIIRQLILRTKTPWYLLDTTRAIKPFIWQERVMPEIDTVTDSSSSFIFLKDQYLFGVRARSNAGYGFWQLVAMCDMDLTVDSFSQVYEGMIALKGTNGDTPLGV